ncbi:MAG: hypothetical protein AAGB19_05460 [Cyanobacteria bacterium P01_F01_bin.3]
MSTCVNTLFWYRQSCFVFIGYLHNGSVSELLSFNDAASHLTLDHHAVFSRPSTRFLVLMRSAIDLAIAVSRPTVRAAAVQDPATLTHFLDEIALKPCPKEYWPPLSWT